MGNNMLEDSISRQAAIENVAHTLWLFPNGCYKYFNDYAYAEAFARDVIGRLPVIQPKRKTNADRIRAMTDEELAEWINKHDCHTNLYGYDREEAILDWLRQKCERKEK